MKSLAGSFSLFLIAGLTVAVASPEPTVIQEALYSGPVSSRGSNRSAVFTDPVLFHYANGDLTPPREGDVSGENERSGTQHWRKVVLDDSGSLGGGRFRGGWLYMTADLPEEKTVIVQADGAATLLINGVPREGDAYSKDWMLIPTKLKKGRNEFWFEIAFRARGESVKYALPPKPVYLTDRDMTVPDLLTSEIGEKLASIRIVNATDKALEGLTIKSTVAGVEHESPLPVVAPMSTRKVPYAVENVPAAPGKQAVQVGLWQGDRKLDEIAITLDVKEPTQAYRRTFISNIDGSLQYYAVREGPVAHGQKPALYFSVHGAGVEALGQAGSYQPKEGGVVIAPTNRRIYGFDWEDWGRLDALEVFNIAKDRYNTDPVHTYLTGHSMGGHGTWFLGATYPSYWAAIAPMAGWRSFLTYKGNGVFEQPDAMETMLNRAGNPSRTLEMARNYLQYGVIIEHGDDDHTVPVTEARSMRELLATFHPDMAYHEEPGGAHWYGVDHERTFAFFKNHELKDVRDIGVLEFRSASPGISAVGRYVTLYQQEKPYEFCGVVAKQTIRSRRQRRFDEDITDRKMEITTENLKIFGLNLDHCKNLKTLTLAVDGQPIDGLPWPARNEVWLEHDGGKWRVIDKPADPGVKNPVRYGGFKDAFRHHMVFVYATGGNAAENAAAWEKARFDAEIFYHDGNGSIDIIPDAAFTLKGYADRSVIIYGNATTNKAWPLLLTDSPVQVNRGSLKVGDRTLNRDDLGVFMIRPRKDSDVASVGVVAATGPKGARTVVSAHYLESGSGYPDLLVLTPEMFANGSKGVVAAGYFGNDWSLEHGEIVWGE